jgi:hypothetical protein
MKRFSLAASMLLVAALASAQTEGVADYKISGGAVNGTGRLYFTKTGYRVEWNMDVSGDAARRGGKGPREMKMTMFGKASDPDVVYTVNDETKTWSSWNTKDAQAEAEKSKTTYTVERLGTDKVAGFDCQNARIKSSAGSVMEVCVTRQLAAPAGWLSAVNRNRGGGASWAKELHDAGVDGFPIRWVTKGEGRTGETVTMEMTKYEKKSVPASMFEVPAGYQKSDAMSVGMSPEQKKKVDDAFQNMTPEQRKQMEEAMKNMTPEQRKQFEEMMKQHGAQPPKD